MVSKICLICSKRFKVLPWRRKTAKYCSLKCFHKSRLGSKLSEERKKRLSILTKERHQAGKYPLPWNKGLTKNEDSRIIGPKKKGKYLECVWCNEKFWAIPSQEQRRKFCSYKCYYLYRSKYLIGENCPAWKGGVKNPNILRHTPEYKEWRNFIFGKDLYTCKMCGKRGGYLEVHHILPRRIAPKFWCDKENGVTLCKTCHYLIKNKEWMYIPKFLGL